MKISRCLIELTHNITALRNVAFIQCDGMFMKAHV